MTLPPLPNLPPGPSERAKRWLIESANVTPEQARKLVVALRQEDSPWIGADYVSEFLGELRETTDLLQDVNQRLIRCVVALVRNLEDREGALKLLHDYGIAIDPEALTTLEEDFDPDKLGLAPTPPPEGQDE